MHACVQHGFCNLFVVPRGSTPISVRRQRTYGGKLADLVSPFLLIVIFNLDRKEEHDGRRQCFSQRVWRMKRLVGQGNAVRLTGIMMTQTYSTGFEAS